MPRKNRINPRVSVKTQKIPKDTKSPQSQKWVFSFVYWRQIKNFGLECSKVNAGWFVSLLDRLKDLSSKSIEEIKISTDEIWRCHAIDWEHRHTTIKKRDFSWIPSDYLESEEIEFYQF